MESFCLDRSSYHWLPRCHYPAASYPSSCFLVTCLPPQPPPPPTPQSAGDVGGWVIVGPFINRCCPSHVCELSRRAPTSFAVVEPGAICWGTWWLKRSERKRGECVGNKAVEVVVEGNKKPVRHLHSDFKWFRQKKKSSWCPLGTIME